MSQDRSAPELPRPTAATGSASDSLSEGSEIKIYHYGLGNPTPTLTEHVAENDSFPPQLGIHYWVGFENTLYIDEFEGIRPEYRGLSNGTVVTYITGMRKQASSVLRG